MTILLNNDGTPEIDQDEKGSYVTCLGFIFIQGNQLPDYLSLAHQRQWALEVRCGGKHYVRPEEAHASMLCPRCQVAPSGPPVEADIRCAHEGCPAVLNPENSIAYSWRATVHYCAYQHVSIIPQVPTG